MSTTASCFYCTPQHLGYMRRICGLQVSTVFLNNDQTYRGRCYVALNTHKTELFQLDDEERNKYMQDVARVAQALKAAFSAEKINYAVYGDIDSHIHFHVVPKHRTSKNWGGPFEVSSELGKEKFLSEVEYLEVERLIKKHLGSA